MSTPQIAPPRVSVVVRSMNRLGALFNLLDRIQRQVHDSFEVVVVEQTPERTSAEQAHLGDYTRDPRIHILDRSPLGGPGARNEGVRAARGDIVILIDDDDLPLGDDWIAAHEAAFDDPDLVGLTGRHVRSEDERRHPYRIVPQFLLRRWCMSYSLMRTPYTFARFDEDVDGVGWLHGTNSSFRRAAVLEAGLWDTSVLSQDEHSLAFKLQRALKPRQYLAFRAHPPALRRMDITGGMDKRRASLREQIDVNLHFVHRVIGHYYPNRLRYLYPAYLAWSFARSANWVWDHARPSVPLRQRVRDSLALPFVFSWACWQEFLRTRAGA